jgi:Ca2+-binding EF-hand superfamily protein
MSEERLKAAFTKFDKDGSGEINASELVSVLLELGKSEEDAKLMAGAILMKCDKNSDMRITLQEFINGFQ